MSPRVAVVTGGNKGIGLSIVKFLVQRGFDGDVYLTARDATRGNEAVAQLKAEHGIDVKFHQLDIDDQASVDALKTFLVDTYGGLDVLVNNAGIAFKNDSTAPFSEQAEVTIRTNFFGTLRVCDALFPILKDHARVVHLSSSAGHLSMIPGEEVRAKLSSPDLTMDQLSTLMNEFVLAAKDGTAEKLGWGASSYKASKVGVSAMGFVHQRDFDNDVRPDLIVNMVHPGYVDTDMSSHKGVLTPDQGADAATYLAMLPKDDPSNPVGQYVWHDRAVRAWNGETIGHM